MTTTDKGNTDSGARVGNGTVSVAGSDHAESIAAGELGEVFARQRAAFERNPAPSLHQRRATLLKLEQLIEQNQPDSGRGR